LFGAIRKTFGHSRYGSSILDKISIQFSKVGVNLDMVFGDMDDLRTVLAIYVFKKVVIG
jgi:hypothetical protein